jgi:hypothetical protein
VWNLLQYLISKIINNLFMRIAFIALIALHGLIHLVGFVKAFELLPVRQITHFISKPNGIIWIIAFFLFIAAALLLFFANKWWWAIGFLAVIVSQILILIYWEEAKFGTIVNVIILSAAIAGFGNWIFYHKYDKDVKTAKHRNFDHIHASLTEDDIQQLPEQVKKYIRYVGCIGKPKVKNFKAEFTGKIRKDKNAPWMHFTCMQYNFLIFPTRLFAMSAKMKGFPIGVYHCFSNGIATMSVKLFSLFEVQSMKGPTMNISETVTFFNDMCVLAPATLIDMRIRWLDTGHNKVEACFTNNMITVTAWLYFNENGEWINFISDDRYPGETGKQYPWSTPLENYQELNGHKLMGDAETIYKYPDGEFVYGKFKLANIEYNLEEVN